MSCRICMLFNTRNVHRLNIRTFWVVVAEWCWAPLLTSTIEPYYNARMLPKKKRVASKSTWLAELVDRYPERDRLVTQQSLFKRQRVHWTDKASIGWSEPSEAISLGWVSCFFLKTSQSVWRRLAVLRGTQSGRSTNSNNQEGSSSKNALDQERILLEPVKSHGITELGVL